MAPLPPGAQRHPWLRYQVEGYTEDIIHDFEQRLDTIFGRQVNQVHVLDFARLTNEMRGTLADRLKMVYTGDKGHELFTIHAFRRLFEIWGPLVQEFILEFFSTCKMIDTEIGLDIANTLCFQLGGEDVGKGLMKTETMTKPASKDDLHDLDDTTHNGNLNAKFKTDDEFVKILRDNTFNEIDMGDVIDHIKKVL
ncbi:hypothetical protein Tco_0786928 [Tanacetum coccineum]